MGRPTVYAACAASLVLGLLFVFVWAPHPWGWEGIDHYHDFGLSIARGESFPTTDYPWGYAYYLAAFYRVFGDRPWIPIVAQVALNALMPLVVFEFARTAFDERVAAVAALLTGLLSFNTVYASTQSSDSICNVIFLTAVLTFARAQSRDDWRLYAIAGALLGTALQFRPNLILMPLVLAAFMVVKRPKAAAQASRAALMVGASIVMLVPWIVRNERLTGEFIPTSTRGTMQLWYGTLQTGPYLKSRAYNPRAAFEYGSFPYTTLDRVALIVTGDVPPCAQTPPGLALVFWTDRDPARRRVPARWETDRTFRADMPPAPAPTVYYFYFDGVTPSRQRAPYVWFVSDDHLGDVDRHGDVLDVFDVVRMLRHIAWSETLPDDRLDFDGDGRVSEADAATAVDALLSHAMPPRRNAGTVRVETGAASAALRFADGSSLTIPRDWSGRVTDVEVRGPLADAVLHATVPFGWLGAGRGVEGCEPIDHVAVNAPYYRAQIDAMRRYQALAFDNIRRRPLAYLAGSAYRAVRVFFIEGSDDLHTAQQFSGSGRIYRAAMAASIVLLILFGAGVWAAHRRGAAIALPLLIVAYIPATLAFVLINMRYSITVQPVMFMFVAAALVSAYEAVAGRGDRSAPHTAPRATRDRPVR